MANCFVTPILIDLMDSGAREALRILLSRLLFLVKIILNLVWQIPRSWPLSLFHASYLARRNECLVPSLVVNSEDRADLSEFCATQHPELHEELHLGLRPELVVASHTIDITFYQTISTSFAKKVFYHTVSRRGPRQPLYNHVLKTSLLPTCLANLSQVFTARWSLPGLHQSVP